MAKFCEKCGAALREGTKFCDSCGEPAAWTTERVNTDAVFGERRISENITLGPDGKYRWIYEMSLFKNPIVFFLIWKIFFFIVLGIGVFVNLVDIASNGFNSENFLGTLRIFGIVFLAMTGLVAVSYLIYAASMGGKYIVIFEMDECGINHKQLPKQAEKARRLGFTAASAGFAAGRSGAVGAGLAASARTEMYSEFARVKKIKSYPKRNLIKVSNTLSHNQVYAADVDFAFVEEYIRKRCGSAKQ